MSEYNIIKSVDANGVETATVVMNDEEKKPTKKTK
jgi:hypothetical protein